MTPPAQRRSLGIRLSKTLRMLTVSALVLICVPLSLAIFLTHTSINRLEEENKQALSLVMHNAASEIEWVYRNANRINYKMSTDSAAVSYFHQQQKNYYEEYALRTALGNITLGDTTVKRAFYLLPDENLVITSDMTTDAVQYIQQNYQCDILSFIEIFQTTGRNILYLKHDEIGNPYAYIVRHIETLAKNIYAIIEINLDSLSVTLSHTLLPKDIGFVCIYQEQSFLSTVSFELTAACLKEKGALLEQRGDYRIMYDEDAQIAEMSFLLLIPNTDTNTVIAMRRLVLFSLLAGGFLTIILIMFIVWINYLPMQRLLAACGVFLQQENTQDEYKAIANRMKYHIDNNRILTQRVTDSENRLRELYLQSLLLGRVTDLSILQDTLKLYNIQFPYMYFAVILLRQADSNPTVHTEENCDDIDVIVHILDTTIEEKHFPITFHLCEIAGDYVIVLNGESASLDVMLDHVTPQLPQWIENETGSINACVISSVYRGVKFLSKAYKETMNRINIVALPTEENAAAIQDKSVSIAAQAIDIIKQQYSDVNINASFIAEQLSLSPSYLSRIFKQQTGLGILEYLHHYRVMSAKQMLVQHPSLSINDIATSVGMINAATLIRVFKKIEGRTPGSYRQENTDAATDK